MKKNLLMALICILCVGLMFTLTSCIDSHEHTYSDEYTYNDVNHWNAATCEHTLKRENREAHIFTDWTEISEYSCEQNGQKERTCTVCGYIQKQEKKAKGHAWMKPVFTWTEYEATATFVCYKDDTHVEVINAVMSNEITTPATCEQTGIKTHTATVSFNNKTYSDTKEEVLEIIDHNYIKELVNNETLKTIADCTTKATYWYSCELCDKLSDTLFFEYGEVDTNAHDWLEPVFTWTDFVATATFTCNINSAHIETLNATMTNAETTPTTCTQTGIKTHTATVTFNNNTYTDIKEEVLPVLEHTYTKETVNAATLKDEATCTTKATYWYSCSECDSISDTLYFENGNELGHDWSLPEFTWTIFEAEATFTCKNDAQHFETLNATMTSEVTTFPTCTTTGIRTYTATIVFEGVTYTDTKEEVIVAVEHNFVDGFCSECNAEQPPVYTRVDADGNVDTTGEYILFGSYPQSEVTDETLKTILTTTAGTLPTEENSQYWTAYVYYMNEVQTNYMWYHDVEYNNELYRGVYFTSYRANWGLSAGSLTSSYQDDNGYTTGNVYWFKYEPVKWRILTEETGKALLLCELIIDGQDIYPSDDDRIISEVEINENNYEHSTIRQWLNNEFYNTAFDSLEQAIIQLTEVDNSTSTTGPDANPYICNNTNDNVFLLSYQDCINTNYGFNEFNQAKDSMKQKKATAYAKCQGLDIDLNVESQYFEMGSWWLRSPSNSIKNDTFMISNSGELKGGHNAYFVHGVVPALWIAL